MSIPSQADVYEILSPYHDRIQAVVERAWAEWYATVKFRARKKFGPVLYPRTMANYVFDAIARHAIAEFADDPSVSVRIEPQTVKFFFRGKVVGRFKKDSSGKLGSNISTQAVLDYIEPDGVLPGLPPETAKIDFVWRANDLNTKLEEILVVARDNHHVVWDYSITDGAAESGSVVLFPAASTDPTDVTDDDLVKPKPAATKKSQNEE